MTRSFRITVHVTLKAHVSLSDACCEWLDKNGYSLRNERVATGQPARAA